ncbi:RNA-directed DNA polymerase, eukaryota, reverse transcriptase zinc-binding domain protein [Tanacetum coccineum]
MEKMSSGANNGAKPLKSILKITRPKGAAGDTIDVAGAGKTKKDGMGIQPFKVRRKVSIAPDGTEHIFTYVQTECSDHVCSSVQMNEVHQVAMPIEDVNEANKSTTSYHVSEFVHTEGIQQVDTNGNLNVANADLCQVRCDGDHVYGRPCNEGIKSFANLFIDMGGVMDSNEARSDGGGGGVKEPKTVPNLFDANDDLGHVPSKKLNFRSFVNEEKVENSDIVLPRDVIDKVKNKYENSLVGYFKGKKPCIPNCSKLCKQHVRKIWASKIDENDDGIFLFKFADKRGREQVLERGPWLIHNTPLILNKWTPSLPLRKDEVTKVLVWVKLHKVPLVAYSKDGLSLIATQIGKPLMLDAFTSTMCVEAWGRISFSRALVEISSNTDLKKEVIMAVPNEDGTSYTREVISVEYEWQPQVKRKKNKDKKADQQPRARHIDGIRLTKPKPNFYWQKTDTNKSGADLVNKGPTDANSFIDKVNGPSTSNSFDILNNVDEGDACCVSSSMGNQEEDQAVGHATVSKHTSPTWNEDFESDDEVDEVIFPEVNKLDEVLSMASNAGCMAGDVPFNYLGLPIGSNMKSIASWKTLVDRFHMRLSSWKANLLSIGGRLTLIKSVLGSLGIYYLSIFRAPESVLQDLERIRANFFWGGNKDKNKMAWVKWPIILNSFDKGGLNIGSLKAFNLALLQKWRWRLLSSPNALWVQVIKAYHGQEGGFDTNGCSFKGIWANIVGTSVVCIGDRKFDTDYLGWVFVAVGYRGAKRKVFGDF